MTSDPVARRTAFRIALGIPYFARVLSGAAPVYRRVLVACGSRIAAYEAAVEGLRSSLAGTRAEMKFVTVAPGVAPEPIDDFLGRETLVVAVGSDALRAVTSLVPDAPIVATMVLSSALSNTSRKGEIVAITLDVPPAAMLSQLKQCFPNRQRIALVSGPALSPAHVSELRNQARGQGYDLDILKVEDARQLMNDIGSLRGHRDFLWCLPDSTILQGPTLSALILAAIRNRLPVIGFSEGMVRAGALIGFYPDYRDIGIQTAELVKRKIEGDTATRRESPRKCTVAVNERVLRVLGLDLARKTSAGLEIIR